MEIQTIFLFIVFINLFLLCIYGGLKLADFVAYALTKSIYSSWHMPVYFFVAFNLLIGVVVLFAILANHLSNISV